MLIDLVLLNGFVLWESYAIIRYLCRTYGMGSLWPDDQHHAAIADQWMEWTNSRFMGTFFPVFWSLIRTPLEQQNADKISATPPCDVVGVRPVVVVASGGGA